jgi:hypothetical protein
MADIRGGRERKIVWCFDPNDGCDNCGRAPYQRRDGREYLYSYDGSPAVCSPRCAEDAKPSAYERGQTIAFAPPDLGMVMPERDET